MKSTRILLALAVLAGVSGLAYVAQQPDISGPKMLTAAEAFVSSLKPDQKEKASIAYDNKERTNWNFIPLQDPKTKKYTRKGLPLEEMTADQKKAALELVKSGTSKAGFEAALFIMGLENILLEQEKTGAMVRNPEWYFFTVFGTPSKTGNWGWRVEGHHLSLNFTLEGTKVVSATPNFFGANPAEVKAGPSKGKRILASSEDPAMELVKSLDEGQKKVALQPKKFGEPLQKSTRPTNVGAAVGLPLAKLTATTQRDLFWKLVTSYTGRMPATEAAAELKLVKSADPEKVTFAYFGATDQGKEHEYRVQGPTFVIEFLNSQVDSATPRNPANHIHSCWRHMEGDFGLR